MNGVIKAHTISFGSARQKITSGHVAGKDSVTEEVVLAETLRAEIALLQADLKKSKQSAEEREISGHNRGLQLGIEQGKKAVADQSAARNTRLRETMMQALEHFENSLNQHVSDLAIEIAATALNNVIGDITKYAELIADSAVHHLRGVIRDSLILIEVSKRDFPDEDDLTHQLPDRLCIPTCKIVARPELEAGACLINLTLGTIDISIQAQHTKLSKALDRLQHSHV